MLVESQKHGPMQVCKRQRKIHTPHYSFTAGRQFLEAEDSLFKAQHASYWECLDAGIHCFIRAIEVFRYPVILCPDLCCMLGSGKGEAQYDGSCLLSRDCWQVKSRFILIYFISSIVKCFCSILKSFIKLFVTFRRLVNFKSRYDIVHDTTYPIYTMYCIDTISCRSVGSRPCLKLPPARSESVSICYVLC